MTRLSKLDCYCINKLKKGNDSGIVMLLGLTMRRTVCNVDRCYVCTVLIFASHYVHNGVVSASRYHL